MNIVVCIKQVPDTKGGVKFNADGTLDRAAMLAIMNPDDKAGLEAALRIKDQNGAKVTVLTMGIFDACDKEVTVWGRADLKDVDDSNLGLKGSPTKIAKASDKVPKGAGEKVNLDPAESVAYLIGKFKEKHII